MCVASLNVAQPCSHRWYSLVQPCNLGTDLSNCQERLKLQGWEARHESCPWCDDNNGSESTHRLFGSVSSSSSSTSSAPTSPVLSGASKPLPGQVVRQRSGSGGSLSKSLSRANSVSSLAEADRGLRHREMNDRLNMYLSADPHEVLPSGKKYYPDYQSAPKAETFSPAYEDSFARRGSVRRWKKAVQLSRGMYKG